MPIGRVQVERLDADKLFEILMSYPTHLDGHRLIVESHVNSFSIREYSRVGAVCPRAASTHIHASRKNRGCKKWKNVGERSLDRLGPNGPLCFIGCWLRKAASTDDRASHMGYNPSMDEMLDYAAEQGWSTS
jgi:hypothetical protein